MRDLILKIHQLCQDERNLALHLLPCITGDCIHEKQHECDGEIESYQNEKIAWGEALVQCLEAMDKAMVNSDNRRVQTILNQTMVDIKKRLG